MTADIRVLTLRQVEELLGWAGAEGWNPGLNDAKAFRTADPNGFYGAFVEGRMVAGISVVAYDSRFGFLGLYICHPDYRGQGYGRAVWNAGMRYLGTRTIGLDGVPEQQDNYRSMGFVARYDTIRMSGTLTRSILPRTAIAPVTSVTPILDLDRACFPADRAGFLQHWIAPPNEALLAVRDGRVCGYMVVRPCRVGQKIGPLFADNLETALDLLGAVEGPVQVDVPELKSDLLKHLEQNGFVPSFQTARMYRGAPPTAEMARVFGVTTLELG